MIIRYLKLHYIVVLCFCISPVFGEIDTTFKRFNLELHADYQFGKSLNVNDEGINHLNGKSTFGTYLRYHISLSQSFKIGVNYNSNNYEFRKYRKDLISIEGVLVDDLKYEESIKIVSGSIGVAYATLLTKRSIIEIEFLKFRIFDEQRSREGTGIPLNQSLIFQGIDYTTDKNFYGVQVQYKFRLDPMWSIGGIALLTSEKIKIARIMNGPRHNLYYGVFLSAML